MRQEPPPDDVPSTSRRWRNLRFSRPEQKLQTPERWTSRHDGSVAYTPQKAGLNSSRTTSINSRGSNRRRVASLKKQGSLFATAAEDIVQEHQSRSAFLKYKLESWLSNRTAQYATLVLVGLILILIGGLLWMIVQDDPDRPGEHPQGAFFEGIWVAWTFMADPGTHATVVMPKQRIVASTIAVLGIIFFASLLGVVVDAIRSKMDMLRQGRSRVVERNHSLILGWTEKSILLIEELCIANQSIGGGTIVVLAKNGKQDMECELKVQLSRRHMWGSKVVFRSGSPLLTHDLIKVGAHRARSIIVLAGDNEPNQADAETLRCILVLRTLPYGLRGFIVAEVRDISNEPLLKMVGGSNCETVPSHDILGRLMLMAGRSPGLAKVYESLLGFEGDEFYMWEWPEILGLTFGDLIGRFPDAIPIGLCSPSGAITLNPQPDTIINKGDKLIVIAEDDDTYKPEPPVEVEEGAAPPYVEATQKPEHIFVAGWRRDISDIFVHLDNLVVAGSELHMMTHCVSLDERNARLEDEGLDLSSLKNIKIIHHFGNTTVRRKLEALQLEACTSCMIFADQAFEIDTMHADSHSLATLLLIRDAQMTRYEAFKMGNVDDLVDRCPIVCEILDPRTQKTIAGSIDVQHSSEFCHSNLMIAQIMAMVSENRTVKALLDEMLGYRGCSVAVFPAHRFAHPMEKVSFWCLAKRAARKRTLLLGFAVKGSIDPPAINPDDKASPRLWDGYDFVALAPSEKSKAKHRKTVQCGSWNYGAGVSPVDMQGDSKEPGPEAQGEEEDPVAPSESIAEDPQDSLQAKVLRLVESIAALDERERQRLGKVLDCVKDVVSSLPVPQAAQRTPLVHREFATHRSKVLTQPRNIAEVTQDALSTRCVCHRENV